MSPSSPSVADAVMPTSALSNAPSRLFDPELESVVAPMSNSTVRDGDCVLHHASSVQSVAYGHVDDVSVVTSVNGFSGQVMKAGVLRSRDCTGE